MIVADNEGSFDVPVFNTSLRNVKRAARDVYDVAPENILVSVVNATQTGGDK